MRNVIKYQTSDVGIKTHMSKKCPRRQGDTREITCDSGFNLRSGFDSNLRGSWNKSLEVESKTWI